METKQESIATQDQTRTETPNSPVGGNLAHHLPAWNLITDNSWVLHYIQGYGLEFSPSPPRDNWPPLCPYLSKEQEMVLDKEIKDLLSKKAVELAPSKSGYFQSYFHSPKEGQPEVSVERPELQILQFTFRSGHSPWSVHKDSEASGSKVTQAGYSDSVLSG